MSTLKKQNHPVNWTWTKSSKPQNVTFRTVFDRPLSIPETHLVPGKTQPDMSLSVSQLIERFTRKQTLPNVHGYYDETIPDLSKMDRLERAELKLQNEATIVDIRKALAMQEAKKQAEDTTAQKNAEAQTQEAKKAEPAKQQNAD